MSDRIPAPKSLGNSFNTPNPTPDTNPGINPDTNPDLDPTARTINAGGLDTDPTSTPDTAPKSPDVDPAVSPDTDPGKARKSQARLLAEQMVVSMLEKQAGRRFQTEEVAKLLSIDFGRVAQVNKELNEAILASRQKQYDSKGNEIEPSDYLRQASQDIYKKYQNWQLDTNNNPKGAGEIDPDSKKPLKAKAPTGDVPSTKNALAMVDVANNQPTRKLGWKAFCETVGNLGYGLNGIKYLAGSSLAERVARFSKLKPGETQAQYEKRMRRWRYTGRVFALGVFAVGTVYVAYKIYYGMEIQGGSTSSAWADSLSGLGDGHPGHSGGSGAGDAVRENIAIDATGLHDSGGHENQLADMFDGYMLSEDIFNQEGKLGVHDWMPPLDGDTPEARGESLQEGLRTSPGELATVLDRMDILDEGMSATEAQARMERDPGFAEEMWKRLTEGNLRFSEGEKISSGEAYGSYYGVSTEEGVIISYDEHVTGEESGVTIMHYTDKNDIEHTIEFRDKCGQPIFRMASQEVVLPQGGGAPVGAETPAPVVPQGGGEVPPPQPPEPPVGNGEVPPPPPVDGGSPPPEVPPPTGGEVPPPPPVDGGSPPPEVPPPTGGEVPPPPPVEQPPEELAPKTGDFIDMEGVPDADPGPIEGEAQPVNDPVVVEQVPGQAIPEGQLGWQASEAVVGGGGAREELNVPGYGAEAAQADLQQSSTSTGNNSTGADGATTGTDAGVESNLQQ